MFLYKLLLLNVCLALASASSFELIQVPRSPILSKLERLTNGQDESIMKAPYMVSLLLDNSLYCGASLLKDDILITAAHCLLVLMFVFK